MDITEIVDNIVIEGDLNPAEYPVANRIRNVNSVYLKYREMAIQLGSKEPIQGQTIPLSSEAESYTETFSVLPGSNTFERTIIDVPIQRVDFQADGSSRFQRLTEDLTRAVDTWCGCDIEFFANEKQVMVENGRTGTLRVTYVAGNLDLFTEADYDASDPVYPTWLPREFHDLLWLEPATIQAEYYKKDRAPSLRNQLTELVQLFRNHYGRNAVGNSRFDLGGPTNYR